MVDSFTVNMAALTRDAETWSEWKTTLSGLVDALPLVGDGALHPLSFSRVHRGQDIRRAYDSVSRELVRYLTDGADQAGLTADKLTAVEHIYREADVANRDDIHRH